MARTMVLDANGKPILVEYNEDGSEAGEVSYTEPFSDITVISSAEYAQYQTRLKDYKTRHADDLAKDARLLSAAEFKSEFFICRRQTHYQTQFTAKYKQRFCTRAQHQYFIAVANQRSL